MSDEVKNLIEIVIILITAIWAIIRFGIERPLDAGIEFDLDCTVVGIQDNKKLLQINLLVENKGNKEHKFKELILNIYGIANNEHIKNYKESDLLDYGKKLQKHDFVTCKLGYYFVRPKVKQRFSYVTFVDQSISFVYLNASFFYNDTANNFHNTERLFKI